MAALIRLVLVSEPGLFRAGLASFLASQPGFEVAGECGEPAEALEVIGRSVVDVVLVDSDKNPKQGQEFIVSARRSGYQGRVLVVTGAPDTQESALVLKQGASGIFLKSEPPAQLVKAIRLVAHGGAWVDQKVIQLFVDQLIHPHARVGVPEFGQFLDERERNVFAGILEGLSNRKIAATSGLPQSSVKNIVQRLFRRADVRSRSQFVRVALGGPAHDSLMRFGDGPAASHRKTPKLYS